jgi:hypothetical protein
MKKYLLASEFDQALSSSVLDVPPRRKGVSAHASFALPVIDSARAARVCDDTRLLEPIRTGSAAALVASLPPDIVP